MNLSPNLVSLFLCRYKEWLYELIEDLVEVKITPSLQQREQVHARVWDKCALLFIEN